MVADEARTLGVIVLTNGDSTRPDAQAKEVEETILKLVNALFDCFETQHSAGQKYKNRSFLVVLSLLYTSCARNKLLYEVFIS